VFCFCRIIIIITCATAPRRRLYTIRSVCHSVSLCLQDYCRSNQPISLKLGVMIGPTSRKNWLTFGDDSIQDTYFESIFHFPTHCGIEYFRRFISISHSHRPIFTTLGEMTDVNRVMMPQHFGSDPASIWILICPEIRFRIPDHLWLRL